MKNCADSKTTPNCRGGWLERPRYFPRQLITPAEMNLEQDYFRHRLRLHNRMLHGWGVVCGALVCPLADEPWRVQVKPGYLLGPHGDEIYIDHEHLIDLRTRGLRGAPGEPAEQSADSWCSEVYVKPEPGGPLYVAVRYEERMARPVRAQPVGCGCDDEGCEYSRWCDGYVIGVLEKCPESHLGEPPDCEQACEGPNPACPPCPTDPWVVLARVDTAADGIIEKIDNCACRRLVVSFGDLWWRCQAQDANAGGLEVEEATAFDRDSTERLVERRVGRGMKVRLELAGRGFVDGIEAAFPEASGIHVEATKTLDASTLSITATVLDAAKAGAHDLLLTHPNGEVLAVPEALRVVALGDPPLPSREPVEKPTRSPGRASASAARTAKKRTAAKPSPAPKPASKSAPRSAPKSSKAAATTKKATTANAAAAKAATSKTSAAEGKTTATRRRARKSPEPENEK